MQEKLKELNENLFKMIESFKDDPDAVEVLKNGLIKLNSLIDSEEIPASYSVLKAASKK